LERAAGGSVSLEVLAVDHQPLERPALCGEGGEDAVEHTLAAYDPAGVA